MRVIKPSFHVWLVWSTIDMLAGQHHLTIDEIEEGINIYRKVLYTKDTVIVAPDFNPNLVRAGTPVCQVKE